MGRLYVRFHEDRCKGEAVMRFKPFYLTAQSLYCDLDLWPFDPKFHRAHTWLMGRLYVKFHEDRCKGEAVMRFKPFYLTGQSLHCDLDLWPFEPKVHRAHAWLMGGLHVKFHEDRWKGEAVIRLKPFYLTARLQTDRRTDRRTDRVIPVYPPPNFVAGGIITRSLLCISTTGSNDIERSDTKLEAPSFPIEYKIFCSTFYAIPYINRFRYNLSSI